MQQETKFQAPLNFDASIAELLQLTQDSKMYFGRGFVDELSLYTCTTKIRKYFSHLLNGVVVGLLEEIELLATSGKLHVFGKVLIDIETYQQLVKSLCQSVGGHEQAVYATSENVQVQEIIRIAQMQAQSIIEQAQQEAQRIIEDAKRQASC